MMVVVGCAKAAYTPPRRSSPVARERAMCNCQKCHPLRGIVPSAREKKDREQAHRAFRGVATRWLGEAHGRACPTRPSRPTWDVGVRMASDTSMPRIGGTD